MVGAMAVVMVVMMGEGKSRGEDGVGLTFAEGGEHGNAPVRQ